MASFSDTLNQTLTPQVLGQIGKKIGVDEATAQKGAEVGVPVILSGMAQASNTPGGAASMMDMLGQADTGMLGDLIGSISGMNPAAGNSVLDSLFGNSLGGIVGQIKQATGLDIGPMLPILAPIVLSALSKFAKSNNLNAGGVANLLQTETQAFANSGSPVADLLSGLLGSASGVGSTMGQTAAAATGAATAAAGSAARTASQAATSAADTVGSAVNQAGATAQQFTSSASRQVDSMARDVSNTVTAVGRPTGITILGVLAIIGGILALCGGGAGLFGGALGFGMAATGPGEGGAAMTGLGALATLFGLGSLLTGVLNLVGGIGLLGLKNWARLLVLIGSVIGVVAGLIGVLDALGGRSSILPPLINVIISGLIIWYLNRPDVKAAFGK